MSSSMIFALALVGVQATPLPPTAAELLPKVATSELSTHPLDGSCYSSFDATQCVKPTFCSLTPAWANKTSSYAATYTYTGSSKTMADAWAHLTNGEEWFAAAFGFQMIRPGFLSDFGLGHVRLLINKQHNLPSQIETIITASPPSDDSPAFGSYEALFTLFCAAMQPAIATYGVEPIYVSLEESTPGTFTVTFSGNTCGPTKEHADSWAGAFGGLFSTLMQANSAYFCPAGTYATAVSASDPTGSPGVACK